MGLYQGGQLVWGRSPEGMTAGSSATPGAASTESVLPLTGSPAPAATAPGQAAATAVLPEMSASPAQVRWIIPALIAFLAGILVTALWFNRKKG